MDCTRRKFTNVPFTGEVSGQENGKFQDGKVVGEFVRFYDSGQLDYRVNYKDGKRHGLSEYYYQDGTVNTEKTGTYKNGVKQD